MARLAVRSRGAEGSEKLSCLATRGLWRGDRERSPRKLRSSSSTGSPRGPADWSRSLDATWLLSSEKSAGLLRAMVSIDTVVSAPATMPIEIQPAILSL